MQSRYETIHGKDELGNPPPLVTAIVTGHSLLLDHTQGRRLPPVHPQSELSKQMDPPEIMGEETIVRWLSMPWQLASCFHPTIPVTELVCTTIMELFNAMAELQMKPSTHSLRSHTCSALKAFQTISLMLSVNKLD